MRLFRFLLWASLVGWLSSCITSRVTEKGAYLGNDKSFVKPYRLAEVALLLQPRPGEEALYQAIGKALQAELGGKGFSSNIQTLPMSGGPALLDQTVRQLGNQIGLVLNPISDSYQRDEMNNAMIAKQLLASLVKSDGTKLADILVVVDRAGKTATQAKEIADVLGKYLTKNGWMK